MVEDGLAVDNALEDVFRAESAKMIRALYAFSRSRQIAEDAVLEAFARAVRDQAHIDDLTAWVWRVAYRVAANELGAAGRTSSVGPEPTYEMPEPAIEVFEAIGQALADPARMRALVPLRGPPDTRDRLDDRLDDPRREGASLRRQTPSATAPGGPR